MSVVVVVLNECSSLLHKKNKTLNKNISMEEQGDILCFLQRFDNDENKNETSSNPGYHKEFSGGWRQFTRTVYNFECASSAGEVAVNFYAPK